MILQFDERDVINLTVKGATNVVQESSSRGGWALVQPEEQLAFSSSQEP